MNKDSSGGDAAAETVKPPPIGMPLPQSQSQPSTLSSASLAAMPTSSSADISKPNPTGPPGDQQQQQNRFSLKCMKK